MLYGVSTLFDFVKGKLEFGYLLAVTVGVVCTGLFICSGGWRTRDDGLLVYIPTPCVSILSYSVRLVRPGELKYIYLYPDSTDVLFTFQVGVVIDFFIFLYVFL